VAAHLEDLVKLGHVIDDEVMTRALDKYPPLRRHGINACYLPNMVRKIVNTCFSPHRTSNRATDPVGHILNKAWPMRCSVRNFSEIIASYIVKYKGIYELMLLLLHTCMAGVYPESTCQATVPVRLILYRHYVKTPVPAERFAAWIQQDNHMLLFVAIKEYIAFCICQVPGLYNVLDKVFHWSAFVTSVTEQADGIRATLNQYAATPSDMFRMALESVCSTRSYKCPTPAPDMGFIGDTMITAVRETYFPDTDVYSRPQRVQIHQLIHRAVGLGAGIGELAIAIGVSTEMATLLQNTLPPRGNTASWRALRTAKCQSTDEALLLHEFVHAWTMCHRIRVHDLPAHIKAQQTASIGRTVHACACCKQLRAFVVDHKTHNNAWACGNQRVLLDDTTYKVYCGKRVEKNVPNQVSRPADNCRSYWKAQQSAMCSYSTLLEIPMHGKILQFYGDMYLLCPGCSCVMRARAELYRGDSIRCVNCSCTSSAASDSICFHCYLPCSEMKSAALSTTAVNVCETCWRNWMNQDSITASVDEETAHRAINEQWGTNRIAAHCACI